VTTWISTSTAACYRRASPPPICGDLPIGPDDAVGNRAKISEAARTMLDGSAVPILLGGDDSVPIPLFQAFEGRGAFTILQIDAPY
jgi:agmatinase